MVDLHPNTCNICYGKVIFTSNKIVYGREYGSGKCYHCANCGAYVATHKPRPTEAMGLLANDEMRELRKRLHEIFDSKWKYETTYKKRRYKRKKSYEELAHKLGISVDDCHFGYFDLDTLYEVQKILVNDMYSIE